jgi:hypothetical protein
MLMPDDNGAGHHPQVIEGGATAQLLDGTFDLMHLVGDPSGAATFTQGIPFTSVTGGRVPSRYFEGALPKVAVARFFLPYPKAIAVTTDTVPIKIKDGADLPGEYSGTVDLVYEFSKPFQIGGYPVETQAVVEIANVINPNPEHKKHCKGALLKHAHMYYKLFDGLRTRPEFVTTRDWGMMMSEDIYFVDPVDCTVGTGCEEGDTDCT